MKSEDFQKLKKLLDRHGFLTPVRESRLAEHERAFMKKFFKKGDIIINKDEFGDTFYLLSQGQARVFVGNTVNDIIGVKLIEEGEFFGEIAIITDFVRSAWIVAASDVVVFAIKKNDLEAIFLDNPKIFDSIRETARERLINLEHWQGENS